MKKHLFEVILTVAIVSAWAFVAAAASEATRIDTPNAAVKVAQAASAPAS